jgi:hypothetical protein
MTHLLWLRMIRFDSTVSVLLPQRTYRYASVPKLCEGTVKSNHTHPRYDES